MRRLALAGWLVGLQTLAACSSEALVQTSRADLFSDAIATVRLEVDYAEGAEPYVGTLSGGEPVWSIFGENLERLFERSPKTLDYPTELSQMEALVGVEGSSFSVDEILEIADTHRDLAPTDSEATFYAVWLDGFFRDGDEVREGVIGVSIGTTGVVAMFKPVIASAEAPDGRTALATFVEQTTLIHELGHAVGLVNNGVPLVSDHHDAENGAHCTNRNCGMYWANEGILDVIPFARNLRETGTKVIFGPECLDDVDAFAESR